MRIDAFLGAGISRPRYFRIILNLTATLLLARDVLAQEAATTLAGSAAVIGSADGPAAHALFHDPAGLAMDDAGNLYIADSQNHTIRKLSTEGIVTTFAGRPGQKGSANGSRTNALFCSPSAIAVAQNGKIYVSDTGNNTIRCISANGMVTILAGAPGQSGSANGVGGAARFNSPLGIAVAGGGTLYVADSGNHTIRKVTVGGGVTTLAGRPAVWGSADGIGKTARFNCPVGVTVDSSTNIYVSDANNYTIRKITPIGVVSTWAGRAGSEGAVDGTGNQARFGKPAELKMDKSGNLYVADAFNCTVRKISTNAVVTTIAGLAGSNGTLDGLGSEVRLFNPYGLAVDHNGNLRVSDVYNETLRFFYNPITASLDWSSDRASGPTIKWRAVAGNRYQLQYRETVGAGNWQNLTETVTATNSCCAQSDASTGNVGQRFYRVVLLP